MAVASTTVHPVLVLLDSLRQDAINLESNRSKQHKAEARSLFTYSDGASNLALLGRTKFAGGSRRSQEHLRARMKVLQWYIKWENRKVRPILKKIKQLETEVRRDKIKSDRKLIRSPLLDDTRVDRKPTGFLDLPGEIRTQIYQLSNCLEVRRFAGSRCDIICDLRKGDVDDIYRKSLGLDMPSRTECGSSRM